ncbi:MULTISPECIES: SUMF1/EgtB/PvdO family nonheme iron enzyme [unclassified Caballeronia]|uniref:SUMF1/EgtB/PvdO family nonheme iron enzyme n=1 Tax=unclassified Caballeronia TaxID=2646786 RepID=UPI0028565BAA|nr:MULTISPECIES: SUMF1/EgtB/PvdO family nonheme iron enzyme [unclassified Caballeronia]MDR5754019.1 SUMF1/EgtB/PvdO family nonheme iron enzyme [Caballeronia sp. LZ024]MDR5840398.1 SUMF1/EgtB/PvdO family nonheme iron enzyme [Caballeronia sp. LZ031]
MWRKLLIVCIFGTIGVPCAQSAPATSASHEDRPAFERIADTPPAPAPRLALVIGNADYAVEPLASPLNDARRMSDALAALGFDVVSRANLTEAQMKAAFADFDRRLGADGTGVVYFAGHGLRTSRDTLLIPVDADGASPARLVTKGIALASVLDGMTHGGRSARRTNIVILDTCLNDPFEPAAQHALALPANTLVAYATAPGSLAAEGSAHGVYTAALLRALATGPRDAHALLRFAADSVANATHGRQVPWVASTLTHDVSFGDARPGVAVASVQADEAAPTRMRGILPKDSSEQYELTFWDSIKDSTYPSDYEAYLKAYPNGRFAALAKARIERLRAAGAKSEAPASRAVPSVPTPAPASTPAVKAKPAAPVETAKPTPTPAAPALPAPPVAAKVASGGEIKDCPNCPILIPLSAGTFTMGSNSDDPAEKPPHRVSIGQPFAIGKYEVTVEQWNACADAGACTRIAIDDNPPNNSPMRNVSWDDAQVYVKWLSKVGGKAYRLPTEAEWEYAARGGTSTVYWWGDQMKKGNADCKDCGDPWTTESPVAVGSFAANPYGLFDMNGSVWEWVADCWHSSYKSAPADGRVWDDAACSVRVIRGGSWREGAAYMQSATRFKYSASVRQSQNGFRVARDMK